MIMKKVIFTEILKTKSITLGLQCCNMMPICTVLLKRLIPPALISFTANLHMTNGKGTYRFPEISFYFRQMLSTMVFRD